MHGIAHHNADDRKSAGQARKRPQIVPAAAFPFQGQHRLSREAQLIGYGHPDASIADVKSKKTRMCLRLQDAAPRSHFDTPGYSLRLIAGKTTPGVDLGPIQSKDTESPLGFSVSN